MKGSIVFILLLFRWFLSSGQDYFELYYTNIQKSDQKNYTNAYFYVQAWLSTGKYFENCDNCTRLSPRGLFKKEMLDSASHIYNNSFPKGLFKNRYIPSEYYYIKKTERFPYIIRTLYKIIGSDVKIIFQSQITFEEKFYKGAPQIYNIQLYTGKALLKLDEETVVNVYKQKLKKDKNERGGPPIRD